MNTRKKTLVIFGACYFLAAAALFFEVKRIQKKFTPEKLETMLSTVSQFRDKTDDLCKYRILGDPEAVGKKYIKINFWCNNSRESRSTLSLEAMNDKTVKGVLTEYARVTGFDYKIIEKNKWICLLNDQRIGDFSSVTVDAATIDCFENENVLKNVKKTN